MMAAANDMLSTASDLAEKAAEYIAPEVVQQMGRSSFNFLTSCKDKTEISSVTICKIR